jgi:CPA1 family monovalent cation:H+ antiporter
MSLFTLLSILVVLTAIFSYLNYRYVKLPTTIGVMVISMLLSLVLMAGGRFVPSISQWATTLIGGIDFDEALLHGMLAFLLFAGAIHINLDDLGREWLPIVLLAIVGTLISTAIVGFGSYYVFGWLGLGLPLIACLLFGALISPTDPIAVLGIMKQVGAPKPLETQMAGESLFNDGVGVVVFLVLLELLNAHAELSVHNVSMLLLQEVGGGLLLGLATGYITYRLLKSIDNFQVEVMLTLALAMGGYALADQLHLSAPIAIVVAGLLIGNHGRMLAMSDKTREHVDMFWELIDEILNAILFLLIGLELLIVPITWQWIAAGAVAIVLVIFSRWLSVFGIVWPLVLFRPFEPGTIRILTWGGLRGGISVALALSLPTHELRDRLLVVTYCVVVFSIVVQGLTIGRIIRKFTA